MEKIKTFVSYLLVVVSVLTWLVDALRRFPDINELVKKDVPETQPGPGGGASVGTVRGKAGNDKDNNGDI